MKGGIMSKEALDELDKTLDQIFEENQAKLPEAERVAPHETCSVSADGYTCTRAPHTGGDHIAHGRLGVILKRWGGAP